MAEVKMNKAGGSFNGEIGVTKTKAEVGAAAGRGVVTEEEWIEFVFPIKTPVELHERNKVEPTAGALITKEMVPDCIVNRLNEKLRPPRKLPPIDDDISDGYIIYPERESYLSTMYQWNYLVDLHVDVVKQHANKGFAEVGVDFTDGVKKIFILEQGA